MLSIMGHGHHNLNPNVEPPKSFLGRHYHWVVAFVLFLAYLIYAGLENNIYSLFTIPVTTDLGVTRGAYSLGRTFSGVTGFFSSLLYIEIYRRFGHRVPAFWGHLVYAGACALYSFSQGVWAFYLGGLLSGLFASFVGTIGASQVVANWFHRFHGAVLGVIMAASGIGGALFAQIDESVIQASSWRIAMLVHAGALAFAGLLILIFVKNRPEKMGLHPLGFEDGVHPDEKKRKRTLTEWGGEAFKGGVAKKPAFWLLVIATFLAGVSTNTLCSIVPSHVQDQGLGADAAATVHSVMFIALAAAKILVGFLCDRFHAHKVIFFVMASNLAMSLLFAAVGSTEMAILSVIIFAPGLSFPTMMPPLLSSDLFGTNSYARSVGILVSALSLAGMTLTPLVNFLYDQLGSFTPIIFGIAGVNVVITLLFIVIGILSERDRKRFEEAAAASDN